MKLRTKLLAWFCVCALFMGGATVLLTNRILREESRAAMEDEYRLSVHQALNNMDLISADIENELLTMVSETELAKSVTAEGSEEARARNIQSKLRYICYDSDYISSLLLISEENASYFGAAKLTDDGATLRRAADENRARLSSQYTCWFRDGEGNVYLKKDIYTVTPLHRSGMLVAQLNREPLRSRLGLDISAQAAGWVCVFSADGKLVLESGGLPQARAEEIRREYLSANGSFSGSIQRPSGQYFLLSETLPSWQVFRLVAAADMEAVPNRVKKLSLLFCALCLLAAAPLLYLLTHSLTRDVKRLYDAMNMVSQGDFNVTISARSRDELGMLARHFQWLVGELQTVTAEKVAQATEKKQAEYEMLEVKYRSLQSQISPHFICNILTTINALAAMGKAEKVSDLSILASRYLRDNLRRADEKWSKLALEINYVEEYLDIYRQVYGDFIQFDKKIPEEALPLPVPNMLLQPLVENTLMHGGFHKGEVPCRISLEAAYQPPMLTLTLADNGCGMPAALAEEIRQAAHGVNGDGALKGFGLKGVLFRLQLLFGGRQRFDIASSPEGTRITLTFETSGDTPPNDPPTLPSTPAQR